MTAFNPNTFVSILNTADRIQRQDQYIEDKVYKPEWYEAIDYQTRAITTIALVTILTITYILFY